MNKKGQALVEFVLILPVFLFLLFSIYDFGMMFTTKNKLESDSSDIVSAFKSNKDIDNIRDLIKKDKYTEAKKIVDSLKKKTLDENQ